SIGYGSGGKVSDYKFFQGVDVARILSLLYMALKTHGQEKDGGLQVHMNILKFYTNDIFNVQDVKFEEFFELLKRNGFIELREDDDGVLKMIHTTNPEQLKFVMGFLN